MSELDLPVLAVDGHHGSTPVGLRCGHVAELRPLSPGETDALLAVFGGMSPSSRALRYLTGLPELPRPMLAMLTDVDADRHVAWVALVAGEPAGIARYVRLAGCPTTAELAVEVVDRLHGRGLATALFDAVTTVADARGVRRVQGTLAASNTASRRLMERVGARHATVESGVLELEGRLRLLEPPVVDRGAVLRLAGVAPPMAGIG